MKIQIQSLFRNAAVAAAAVMMFVLAGCGLPNYTALGSPVSTTSASIPRKLSFTTVTAPVGVTVTGYALYYKVYRDQSDYNALGEADRTAINHKDAQTGSSTLTSKGFVRAGELSATDLPANQFNIRHLGSGDTIVLDFPADANPVAGNALNAASAPGSAVANRITLARGYIDYRTANDGLRRFYNDWAFGSVFTDGDLRRPPGKQPATVVTDLTGTSIVTAAGRQEFVVAFAVYAVGLIQAELTPLSSQPTHLGSIRYSDISAVRQ